MPFPVLPLLAYLLVALFIAHVDKHVYKNRHLLDYALNDGYPPTRLLVILLFWPFLVVFCLVAAVLYMICDLL